MKTSTIRKRFLTIGVTSSLVSAMSFDLLYPSHKKIILLVLQTLTLQRNLTWRLNFKRCPAELDPVSRISKKNHEAKTTVFKYY